jgi:arginyl-tRNA synthetase
VTPEEIAESVLAAVRAAVAAGDLVIADADLPVTTNVERPKVREHGDYASNVAMLLAKKVGRPPREIADAVATQLAKTPGIATVDVAGPGFLNITLETAAQGSVAAAVLREGAAYGRSDGLTGTRVNLEFISANPTGPLHLGHARWAAVGDAMARVLTAAGAEVTREFYVNDRGVQMDRFGASLAAHALGQPVPDDGYHGEYVGELAVQIVTDHPEYLELPPDEQLAAFREAGLEVQLAEQRRTLDRFRTHFDVWSSERELHESGAVDRGLARLREQGHVFESDGAVWLRTTDFGDDKDRVLIKGDGELTYFAADTAYYVDKRARGFDVCIYLLGADHHGYVQRLRAVAACAGDDPDRNIQVLIGQLVKILRGGEEVRLAKRAGDIVTLQDFVDEVGVDAARYSLARYPADSPLTLDVAVLTARQNENHVFYVQYVAARTASVTRNARELGYDLGDEADFDPGLLDRPTQNALLGLLAQYPRVVAMAGSLREPHRVARFLEDVAGAYHRFYDDEYAPGQKIQIYPKGDDPFTPAHRARMWLNAATRQVIENGLGVLGVTAPERL